MALERPCPYRANKNRKNKVASPALRSRPASEGMDIDPEEIGTLPVPLSKSTPAQQASEAKTRSIFCLKTPVNSTERVVGQSHPSSLPAGCALPLPYPTRLPVRPSLSPPDMMQHVIYWVRHHCPGALSRGCILSARHRRVFVRGDPMTSPPVPLATARFAFRTCAQATPLICQASVLTSAPRGAGDMPGPIWSVGGGSAPTRRWRLPASPGNPARCGHRT